MCARMPDDQRVLILKTTDQRQVSRSRCHPSDPRATHPQASRHPRRRAPRSHPLVPVTRRDASAPPACQGDRLPQGTHRHGSREAASQLRRDGTDELMTRYTRLRTLPSNSAEHRATVIALRHAARRILMLEAEANDLGTQTEQFVKANVSWLLEWIRNGLIRAAQSSPGRTPAGCAATSRSRRRSSPIPASSGHRPPGPMFMLVSRRYSARA